MGSTWNDVHSYSVSVFRGVRGLIVSKPAARQPEQLLELYEFEACPFCRKVREVLSEMDLEYICHPTGKPDAQGRQAAIDRGGKALFPFLVDPNTNTEMYESEAIIDYLLATYGEGRSTVSRALAPVNTATSGLASLVRPTRGGRVRREVVGRAQPEQRLQLYNMEASPYCRKVRETLVELDLPYRASNVAKRSRRRPELVARGGKMMVPFLIDDNTGTEMYESDDIIAYLERTYGRAG